MPWEAVSRPAAATAVMLNAGSSITATTKLCHFSSCLLLLFLFIIEREKKSIIFKGHDKKQIPSLFFFYKIYNLQY